MGRTMFIADMHLGHENIIRLCNRPFDNVEQMNAYMIQAWNAKVQTEDEVYILGDVAFKFQGNMLVKILNSLKGTKYLIIGNHDGRYLKDENFKQCFAGIYDIKSMYLGNTRIVMCHYPLCEWEGYFRGAYHIYGHIHNTVNTNAYKIMSTEERALNAGADIISFTPATFEELVMYNKQFRGMHKG